MRLSSRARRGLLRRVVVLAAVIVAPACGARSELDGLDAGGTVARDARVADDGSRDARVPDDAAVVVDAFVALDASEPLACDGLPLPRIGEVSTEEIPPRMSGIGVAIPDPEGVLILGGSTAFGVPSETMAFLDLGTMRGIDLPVIGETIPLDDPIAVYDSMRDQVILVGGTREAGRTPADDVFVVTGEGDPGGLRRVVTRRIDSYPPGGVRGHAAAYDPINDRVVVHGGTGEGADPARYASTWVLDLASERWRELLPATESPPPGAIAMGYDPRRRRLVELTAEVGGTNVEVHVLVLDAGAERWMRIGTMDFAPSTRGGLTWDERACGFHLLSARRTRCVLEHWVLVVEDDSVETVMRGELVLEPGHFRGSAPFLATSNRMVLLASEQCSSRDTVASREAAVIPLVR